eukprot:s3_g19.t1
MGPPPSVGALAASESSESPSTRTNRGDLVGEDHGSKHNAIILRRVLQLMALMPPTSQGRARMAGLDKSGSRSDEPVQDHQIQRPVL